MHILVVGAGVIGTVYGAHLGAVNHRISVLAHGERTAAIAVRGLHARDITSGIETHAPAAVVTSAAEWTSTSYWSPCGAITFMAPPRRWPA